MHTFILFCTPCTILIINKLIKLKKIKSEVQAVARWWFQILTDFLPRKFVAIGVSIVHNQHRRSHDIIPFHNITT